MVSAALMTSSVVLDGRAGILMLKSIFCICSIMVSRSLVVIIAIVYGRCSCVIVLISLCFSVSFCSASSAVSMCLLMFSTL